MCRRVPPQQGAKSTRVVVADTLPGFEHDVEMVMLFRDIVHMANPHGARHSQVAEQATFAHVYEYVFCSPLQAKDCLSHGLLNLRWYRPAQGRIAHHHGLYPLAYEGREDAAECGFNFW